MRRKDSHNPGTLLLGQKQTHTCSVVLSWAASLVYSQPDNVPKSKEGIKGNQGSAWTAQDEEKGQEKSFRQKDPWVGPGLHHHILPHVPKLSPRPP